jgi:hypothetical protein
MVGSKLLFKHLAGRTEVNHKKPLAYAGTVLRYPVQFFSHIALNVQSVIMLQLIVECSVTYACDV